MLIKSADNIGAVRSEGARNIEGSKLGSKVIDTNGAMGADVPSEEVAAAVKAAGKVQIENAAMEIIVAEASKNQEEIPKEHDTAEDNRTDRVHLSNESRGSASEAASIAQSEWTTEMEEKAWSAILKWSPSLEHTLSENLKQLQEVFDALKKAILENTSGQQQEQQLLALDEAILSALKKLKNFHLEELLSFIMKYEDGGTLKAIELSLFKLVTGGKTPGQEASPHGNIHSVGYNFPGSSREKSDSLRSAAGQFGNERSDVGDGHREAMKKAFEAAELKYAEKQQKSAQGFIYKPVENGRISVSSQDASHQLTDRELGMKTHAARFDLSENLSAKAEWVFGRSFSAYELEKAGKFVSHINKEGISFTQRELTEQRSVLAGISAGTLYLKAQAFSSDPGVSPPMGKAMKSAVERFVFFCLLCSEKSEEKGTKDTIQEEMNVRIHRDRKESNRIYQAVLSSFQQTKNPEQSILTGIRLALELLEAKEEKSEGLRKLEKQAEFTGGIGTEKNIFEGFDKRIETLKRNWNQYLKFLELDERYSWQFDTNASSSPWATAMNGGAGGGSSKIEGSGMLLPMVALWSAAFVFIAVGIGILMMGAGGALSYCLMGGGLFAALGLVIAGKLNSLKKNS